MAEQAKAEERVIIDLSGDWHYDLKDVPSSVAAEGKLQLPGTLDNQRKSVYNPESEQTSQLRREFSFEGEARYSKRIFIPKDWEGKYIELFIERTKPAAIFIDGEKIGYDSRISSPQRYDLSEVLTPGGHSMEIIVNNSDSIPPIVAQSSNAIGEFTQTNWNGLLGDFSLKAKNKFHIKNIEIGNEHFNSGADIKINFSEDAPSGGSVSLKWNNLKNIESKIEKGKDYVMMRLPLSEKDFWSAGNPTLHELKFILKDPRGRVFDEFEVTTGFRDFSQRDKIFYINGIPTFLRGTVNSAVFPQTTHAPVDENTWMEYFKTLKEYGLNHVRFHSWTPPEAAFSAADKTGFYLMVELPIWGELDRDLERQNRFLTDDLIGLMESFRHHPSFVMFSPGNELWGDISLMEEYMNFARILNPRILSTYGSNVYLGMHGEIGEEDFIVATRTRDDSQYAVRGSFSFIDDSTGGFFNSSYPGSFYNYETATNDISVPVVSHEVGQYQSYPDFSEIDKYTGNLRADNLKEYRRRAEEAGTYSRADRYREASGKWAAKLYKAEMEMAQRSPGIGGFELFGIQDYPGQGLANVGMLNNFMEPKGFVSPEVWRNSSDDVLILAEFPKFSFMEGEIVEIPLKIINYSEDIKAFPNVSWVTEFSDGVSNVSPGYGIIPGESVFLKMPETGRPRKYTLKLQGKDSFVGNEYDFYVFPENMPEVKNVKYTTDLEEALVLLGKGERVLLSPEHATVANATLPGLFTPDFWNYGIYKGISKEMQLPVSPGTLGLLINNEHPALKSFPTDIHTDWQWYPIVANSYPIIIDRLPKDYSPIIEVIDNAERSYPLALIMEFKIGKGKLMIVSSDMEKASHYPEGKWLLQSLKEYMGSKEFNPTVHITPTQLRSLLTKPTVSRKVKELF